MYYLSLCFFLFIFNIPISKSYLLTLIIYSVKINGLFVYQLLLSEVELEAVNWRGMKNIPSSGEFWQLAVNGEKA